MLILCNSKWSIEGRTWRLKSESDRENWWRKKKSWRSQWIKKGFSHGKEKREKEEPNISEEESEENSLMESHEKSIHSQQVATIFLLLCLPVVHVSTIPFKRAMKRRRTMLLCNHHHWISIVTSKTLRDISLFTNIFSFPLSLSLSLLRRDILSILMSLICLLKTFLWFCPKIPSSCSFSHQHGVNI